MSISHEGQVADQKPGGKRHLLIYGWVQLQVARMGWLWDVGGLVVGFGWVREGVTIDCSLGPNSTDN